jgi:hypothetical protein
MTHPAPRVLRVGVVHDGSIIHERLIPPAARVTIGSGPDATLTVPGQVPTTPLFLARSGRYRLVIPPDARGQVQTAAGMVDLSGLVAARGRRPTLEDTDRGKLVIGGITVLFQLVDAPPMPARMLKGSFRPRLVDEDDPLFLGILSLCGAAAAVLMVYVSTLTPPPLVQIGQLPDYFVHGIALSTPPPEVEPVELPEVEPVELPGAEPVPVAATPTPEEVQPQRPMTPQERAIADAVARQARRDEVIRQSAVLNALIRNRGEGPEIFRATDTTGEALIAAAGSISAPGDVASVEDGARLASDGSGRGDAGLEGGIQTSGGGGQAGVAVAPETQVKERTLGGAVKPETPPIADDDLRGRVSDAMALLSPRIRSCYERRIKEDPTLSGRLVLEVDLVGGRVSDAFVSGSIHDDELTACVESAAMKWQVPGVDGVTLKLPFALSPVQ